MDGSPNFLAWTALVLCFPVSLLIVRKWRAPISVPIVLILGQMFMPEVIGFDIASHLPTLDKSFLPQVGALCGCYLFRRKSLINSKPLRGFDLFIIFRLVGYFFSSMLNRDPLVFPHGVVPGLSIFSFVSGSLKMFFYWWPSVYLGRTLIRTSKDLENLFKILSGAALIYTLFMLVEMRASPQLNHWIYGYHQHDFIQSMRDGGYRPLVFMRHGLILAFFMAVTIITSSALAKIKVRILGLKARTVALYLMLILIFSHSLGALLYVGVAMPLVWFAKVRTQTRVAIILAVLALSYPTARAFGIVPVDDITAFVREKFGEDRAGSLGLRLSEEKYIMERTLQRWVFGWGGTPRPFRLDPYTGANRTTPDGIWAIQFGQEGAVGFACLFGMLAYPVLRCRRALANVSTPQDRTLVGALALVAAFYMVELIPNSSIDPYATFLTAALAGVVKRGLEPDREPSPEELPVRPGEATATTLGYS